MLSLDKLRVWLRMLFARKREVQRLDAELNFHLEELTAENLARGMSPTEARQKALRAFGNPMLVREQAGNTWSWNRLELLAHNVRIGIRTLARTPGFAIVSILIIAIGMGTNAALFTVVRSVLLKPLPFREPERLIRLYEHSTDDKFPRNDVAGGIFAEWKKQSHGFSELASAVWSGVQPIGFRRTTAGKSIGRHVFLEFVFNIWSTAGTRTNLQCDRRSTLCQCHGDSHLGTVEAPLRRRSHNPESGDSPRCESVHSHRHHAALVYLSGPECAAVDADLSRNQCGGDAGSRFSRLRRRRTTKTRSDGNRGHSGAVSNYFENTESAS